MHGDPDRRRDKQHRGQASHKLPHALAAATFRCNWRRHRSRHQRKSGVLLRCRHLCDKPVAVFGDGLDVNRRPGEITQSFAQLHDGCAQTVIEVDEGVGWPKSLAQLFAGNDLSGTFEELNQDEERLFSQLDGRAIPAQLHSTGVHVIETEMPGPTRTYWRGHNYTPRWCQKFSNHRMAKQ
jgi:hypothetical protein